MTIGYAVLIRKGMSSAISVVEDKPTDDNVLRQTKEFIRAMTPIVLKPDFADQDMAEIFNVLEVGIITYFLPKKIKNQSLKFFFRVSEIIASQKSVQLLLC